MKRVQREFPETLREPGEQEEGHGVEAESSPSVRLAFMASTTSFGAAGSLHHPIFSKFQSDVTQFLNHAHEHDCEDSRFRRGSRWFRLTYVLIGIAIFVFLTLFLLPAHADLYFGRVEDWRADGRVRW